MIEHSWNELQGQALENYKFRLVQDPRLAWPILPDRAANDAFVGIVQYYEYDKERLPCCVCSRAIHHAGAVVQLKDLTFRLVGSCCGRAHFGSEWAHSKSAFDRAERSALYQKRARSILARRAELELQIYSLRQPINELEETRRSLKTAFGDSFFPLIVRELLRSSGRLSYEESLGRGVTDQGGAGTLRHVQQDTLPLTGWRIFSVTDKRKRLETAIGRTKAKFGELENALMKSRVQVRHLKAVEDCRDELIAIIDLYNDCGQYSQPSNAEILNFWFEKKSIPLVVLIEPESWIIKASGVRRAASMRSWNVISYPSALLSIQDENP